MTGDRTPLRERLDDALTAERWGSKHQLGEHGHGHRYYAPCGICQGDVEAIVGLVLPVVEAETAALRKRLAEAEQERDLAIAHDRQPYPTAWAYEQACKALEAHRQRAEQAEAAVERVRRLQELTITASCRVEAINQARDTLAVLEPPKETP